MVKLTFLDTACLGLGLWLLGISHPFLLGLIAAVLAWVPYVGSAAGCVLVVMVAATDFPNEPRDHLRLPGAVHLRPPPG